MSQPFRLSGGGMIDRTRPISFRFNDLTVTGYHGDTVASALLANGIHFVARSLKYHRPRGIMTAGLEEPSALLAVTDEDGTIPNLKAPEIVLRDGLDVRSQNHWPSLQRDYGAVMQVGARLMSPGFYYKTFMWPHGAWHRHYAKRIRRIAGHGVADPSPDTALYDKRHLHCDILVIGAGAAGIAAATTAARGGATLVVVEQDNRLGGALLHGDGSARAAAQDAEAEFKALSNVTVLTSASAFGSYDHGSVLAAQTLGDHPANAILWKIRARRIILASGAIEKPLVFPDNDRPGIMLAGAVRIYIRRFAVKPGTRAVLAISDPVARAETEKCLNEAGIEIAGVLADGDTLLGTRGSKRLSSVKLKRANGRRERLGCDLLCVSGGWSATAHMFAHAGGKLAFDDQIGSLLPVAEHGLLTPVGGARGSFDAARAASEGTAIAQQAMGELEMHVPKPADLPAPTPQIRDQLLAGPGKGFVDFQNDVVYSDIAQAIREGYDDVELVKRYTTLGMGTDQGKTSWTNAIEEIARLTKRSAREVGHTSFRPAYSPVTIGALVGADVGQNMRPIRRTPFHARFKAIGCVFQTSGDWHYSRYFPQAGEDMTVAITREVLAVRNSLGCVDMSTLGKFEVHGMDAMTFLSRVYCNNIASLKSGRLRYGLMLREDGIVFDDGTIACLADNHFLITATTVNRASVWRHLQRLMQVDWPDLDVHLTDVSDHWATLAIAGPRARDLLQALSPDFDVERDSFPFASVRQGLIGGDMPVRVSTVSFSGELSYEINTPAGYAETLLQRILAAGYKWGITPYGLEALDALRIEKGHLSIGTEIDGRRTPDDLGLGRMVSRKKDFLGSALLNRPALQAEGRTQLIGLVPVDRITPIPLGAHLSDQPMGKNPSILEGYLTASIHSPTLGYPIALAWLNMGASRQGARLWALSPIAGVSVEVEVTSKHFYDPSGERLHG